MKKCIFIWIAWCMIADAAVAQVRFGLTVGGNASNFTESGIVASSDRSYKLGFQGGLVADFGITSNFSVIPELLFSQRGSAYVAKYGDVKNSVSTTLNYLQLPVNLALKFSIGGNSKLLVFAGGYTGYGLSGQMNFEAKMDGQTNTSSEDLTFGTKDNEVNPFDYGVNAGFGAQFGKSFIKVQYNLGLNNLYNGTDTALKNTNIGLSLGYFF